jgi:hypothetical protein
MCRSKANGGRRCTGGTGPGTATATPSTMSTSASMQSGVVPSRERTDALAAALPADRTGWDGKPLSESDRRFYALRESGYHGPIDQAGYPDTASQAADVLRDVARRRGESVDW